MRSKGSRNIENDVAAFLSVTSVVLLQDGGLHLPPNQERPSMKEHKPHFCTDSNPVPRRCCQKKTSLRAVRSHRARRLLRAHSPHHPFLAAGPLAYLPKQTLFAAKVQLKWNARGGLKIVKKSVDKRVVGAYNQSRTSAEGPPERVLRTLKIKQYRSLKDPC